MRGAAEKQNGCGRQNGVANAQFIKHIRVRCRQIGNCEFAQQQPLEHRFVNDAADDFLIRTD
jgi:hypothetical protein